MSKRTRCVSSTALTCTAVGCLFNRAGPCQPPTSHQVFASCWLGEEALSGNKLLLELMTRAMSSGGLSPQDHPTVGAEAGQVPRSPWICRSKRCPLHWQCAVQPHVVHRVGSNAARLLHGCHLRVFLSLHVSSCDCLRANVLLYRSAGTPEFPFFLAFPTASPMPCVSLFHPSAFATRVLAILALVHLRRL